MGLPKGKEFEMYVCGSYHPLSLENLGSNEKLTDEEKILCKEYLIKKSANEKYNIEKWQKEKFFKIIEKIQGWKDAEQPPENLTIINKMMGHIRREVKIKIGDQKMPKISYFTANSSSFTPLDDIGIDCYFKIGEKLRITIDVKSFSKESQEGKVTPKKEHTDILLYRPESNKKDEVLEDEIATVYSSEIMSKFDEKFGELEEAREEFDAKEETTTIGTREDIRRRSAERMLKRKEGEKKIFMVDNIRNRW